MGTRGPVVMGRPNGIHVAWRGRGYLVGAGHHGMGTHELVVMDQPGNIVTFCNCTKIFKRV
jgi:hypothetical protein